MHAFAGAQSVGHQLLTSLCEDAEAEHGVAFGGRIWLLPRWYILTLHHDHAIRLAHTEVLLQTVKWPRMVSLARVFGSSANASSKVKWTIGKGLLGYLTFRRDGLGFDVVQHETAWPDGVEQMSERQWGKLGPAVTRSRTLKDVQALRALYATAIGVSLLAPDSGARLGCVTLHTMQGHPLTDKDAEDVVLAMLTKMPELGRQIVNAAKLKLD